VRCGQIVVLGGFDTHQSYPEKLRRIKFYDTQRDKRLTFLTNQLSLPAATIAELYCCRWQVEIFFKWIKQHLHIKAFYGTSENPVKTQIWIAVAVYVLAAIVKKRMQIELSLYTISIVQMCWHAPLESWSKARYEQGVVMCENGHTLARRST
jgi:Transposase DDE domain